jgi:hypothetical protein
MVWRESAQAKSRAVMYGPDEWLSPARVQKPAYSSYLPESDTPCKDTVDSITPSAVQYDDMTLVLPK